MKKWDEVWWTDGQTDAMSDRREGWNSDEYNKFCLPGTPPGGDSIVTDSYCLSTPFFQSTHLIQTLWKKYVFK